MAAEYFGDERHELLRQEVRLRLGQAAVGAYGPQWSAVLADKVSAS